MITVGKKGHVHQIYEEDRSWWAVVQPFVVWANLLVLLPAAVITLRWIVGTRSLVLVTMICFFALSIYAAYDRRYTVEM
ncbi:hypothetical protein PMAYCL1PPCAC_13180, partial [Pristionchus mayeri]